MKNHCITLLKICLPVVILIASATCGCGQDSDVIQIRKQIDVSR